jgi:hypothetical protein
MPGRRNQLANREPLAKSDEAPFVSSLILHALVREKKPMPKGYCICVLCRIPRREYKEGVCKNCDVQDRLARQFVQQRPPTEARVREADDPIEERKEARRSRAYALAKALQPGPAQMFQLRQEGWLDSVVIGFSKDCPEWFVIEEVGYVSITPLCRKEVLMETVFTK